MVGGVEQFTHPVTPGFSAARPADMQPLHDIVKPVESKLGKPLLFTTAQAIPLAIGEKDHLRHLGFDMPNVASNILAIPQLALPPGENMVCVMVTNGSIQTKAATTILENISLGHEGPPKTAALVFLTIKDGRVNKIQISSAGEVVETTPFGRPNDTLSSDSSAHLLDVSPTTVQQHPLTRNWKMTRQPRHQVSIQSGHKNTDHIEHSIEFMIPPPQDKFTVVSEKLGGEQIQPLLLVQHTPTAAIET